jgi:hypothetical protein
VTRQPSGPDFALPESFIDDVMRRVEVAPRPMPVRSFWSAVRDRSAFDVVGSVAVAWRLLMAGGRVPAMVRAQAFALVLLVAVSVGGTGVLAAAAAYRTVAPIVFRDDPRELLSESAPTDAPDVVPHASSPIVVAVPDRPDGRAIARNGARNTSIAGAADDATTDRPLGKDRAAEAEDEDDAGDTGASHDGGGSDSDDGDGASDGEHDGSDEDAPDGGDDGGDHESSGGAADDDGESGSD